jgi:hypothetical protein
VAQGAETEVRTESGAEQARAGNGQEEIHVEPKRKPEDLLVPLVDEHEAGRIYSPAILRASLWGALLGALLFGWLGAAMANGDLPVAGLGQWAVSGPTLAAVTGGGLGIALGGLTGALIVLYWMPARRLHEHESSHMQQEPAERIVESSPDGK